MRLAGASALLVLTLLTIVVAVSAFVAVGLVVGWRWWRRDRTSQPAKKRYDQLSVNMKSLLRALALAFAALSTVAVALAPFVAADDLADRIKRGDELKMPVLPGIPGLSAPLVDASTVDGEPLATGFPTSKCLHLLGSAGGVVILYDHRDDKVLRLPQERINLQHPCR